MCIHSLTLKLIETPPAEHALLGLDRDGVNPVWIHVLPDEDPTLAGTRAGPYCDLAIRPRDPEKPDTVAVQDAWGVCFH